MTDIQDILGTLTSKKSELDVGSPHFFNIQKFLRVSDFLKYIFDF